MDYLIQAKQTSKLENLKNNNKYRNYNILTFYFLWLERQTWWGWNSSSGVVGLPHLWLWQVLYPLWPQFFCFPILLGKEPGWSLIFALTDCSACRNSSSLILQAWMGLVKTNGANEPMMMSPLPADPSVKTSSTEASAAAVWVSPSLPKELTLNVHRIFKYIFIDHKAL